MPVKTDEKKSVKSKTMKNEKSPSKPTTDVPPKRIIKTLGRLGNEYAWLDKVLMDWGDGKARETFIAGVPDGAFALPLLDNGNVVLVHSFRPFNHGWVYELPGGIIDAGECEEDAALRECEEEAGYKAKELRKIAEYVLAPAMRCTIHLFVATKLVKTKQRLDDAERGMTAHEFTPTQVYEMVLDGTIKDSQTIIAVLTAKELGLLKVDPKEFTKGHPF